MRLIDVLQDGFEVACAAVRRRPGQDDPGLEAAVRDIIADVRARGDAALMDLSRRFDAPDLDRLEIPSAEWESSAARVPGEVKSALELAARRITKFHERYVPNVSADADAGVLTGYIIRPLRRVGIYVPGGTAAYPSTVLMTAIPARVAGVREIIACTPAQRPGSVPDAVLLAARLAGVTRLFAVGGAQAIAALAFGTKTIPRVDKIVGPGNAYVNTAKRLLYGTVAVDLPAGPSETCVVADDTARPAFVAAELLTQAEHDALAAAFLITPSDQLARSVLAELESGLETLPRRQIASAALENNSAVVVTDGLEQAYDLANVCAPEHLVVMTEESDLSIPWVRDAGTLLVGEDVPQTLADYLAGPSHVLPTGGAARFASVLGVHDFFRRMSFTGGTYESLAALAPALITLARAEGFEAHARAVEIRQAAHDHA